jgi:hypothetical protein
LDLPEIDAHSLGLLSSICGMGDELHYLVSFSILINGVASLFFKLGRGLRQGFPLSPLLFLLIVEGLSRLIKEVATHGSFKGICIGPTCNITHLLFVDDILIFCEGTRRVVEKFKNILELFCKSTGMIINIEKSTISMWGVTKQEHGYFSQLFPY